MLLGTKKNQQTNTGPLFSLFSTKNRHLRILQISSRSVEIIGGLKKPPGFFLSKTRGKLLPNEQKRKAPKLIHVYGISFGGEFFFSEKHAQKKQNKTKQKRSQLQIGWYNVDLISRSFIKVECF